MQKNKSIIYSVLNRDESLSLVLKADMVHL